MLVTVTLENIGKLAQGKLIQPLNKTYLPTVHGPAMAGIPDFYDVGRQYSTPYVMYTTGIAWRNDWSPRTSRPWTTRTTSSGTRRTKARSTC